MELPKNAYFRSKIVPYSEAKVGVATLALHYGLAVFGGLRGYWNDSKQKMYIFRPVDHYRRFLRSARMMCMDLGLDEEALIQITVDLLKADGNQQDVYVRPLAYKSEEGIGVRLHDVEDDLTIFSMPFGRYVTNDTGAHVTISSWRRVDDNAIPARGKISGAYANSALVKTDAVRAGFDEALVLDQIGHISEGSAMNVFMVRDGELITPPVTGNILEGITRRSIIDLAKKELGIPVHERSIDRTEVFICDEFFMTGTAAQVTAVTKCDHRTIGSGEMGLITSQLRELFDNVVRGKRDDYAHWLREV